MKMVGLFIIFQILFVTSEGYKSLTLCETENTRIECQGNINVLNAFYGRKDTDICASHYGNATDCDSTTALETIKRNCNGRETCWLSATSNVFADPCPGTFKYLQISYECVNSDSYYVSKMENNKLFNITYQEILEIKRELGKVQTELKEERQRIQKLESNQEKSHIAFFAGLGSSIVNPAVGSLIAFDDVSLNLGSAYDGTTGIFTAPVPGIYYFSVEATSKFSSRYGKILHMLLMKNGDKTMGYIFLDHNTTWWIRNTASASIFLKKGDTVSVKVRTTSYSPILNGNSGSSLHTIFTGFLVSQMNSE